jgi:hypothetical protein
MGGKAARAPDLAGLDYTSFFEAWLMIAYAG